MRRLWVVYNPRSSQQARIQTEILEPVRKLRGVMVGKYVVKPTGFADNVEKIARVCSDGDMMIVAGGDGTAAMALNGVLRSGKDVSVGVLGYGNFNDVATMLGGDGARQTGRRRDDSADGKSGGVVGLAGMIERLMAGEGREQLVVGERRELYPLEVRVNGEHWRYALSYMTVGLLAEATELIETPEMRTRLAAGKRGSFGILMRAVKWYRKNRLGKVLPEGALNGVALAGKTTDYLAVNGSVMARMMKAEGWWRSEREFGSAAMKLGGFWRMVRFGLRSITSGVPLVATQGDVIEFSRPSTVAIQAEGELERLEGVQKIEVRKVGKSVKVV